MAWAFSQRYWRVVVVAMLALLHVAVFRGVADPWARALLLAHLGLLLLWQPFLRGEQRVSLTQGVILALVATGVMLRLDWWFLAFWVVVLAGLVGGKVYQQHARWQRRCYLVVLAYLLALLAIAILPEIAPRREIQADVRAYAEYGLPLAFVLIALFPSEPDSADAPHIIDFFYSVFVMLVIVVVILGSFTFMSVTRTPYLEALTATIFVTAGGMLLVALAWNPRSGGGIDVFFFPLPVLDRPAGGEVDARARRAAASGSTARTLPERSSRRAAARAVGGRRALARRGALGRAGDAHAPWGRLRFERARAHHLFALSPRADAALAPAPARPAARGVLRRQAARGEAAPGELPAGGARDRRAHDARHQEPAAVALGADLGGRARQRRGLGAASGAAAPSAAAHRAAPFRDAGEAAAPPGRWRALRGRAPLVGSARAPVPR